MINKKILAFTSLLFFGGSLMGQLTVDENDNKKVISIEVEGPRESGELKRAKPDGLNFISGDLFNGSLLNITEKGLVWKHPDATSDITFKQDNLDVINFGHVPVNYRKAGVSDISLTNGDRLFGTIDELNKDYLVLDTWYAGKLKIERPMIHSIASGVAVSKAIYEGPNNFEEWKVANRGSWKFKDDYLYNTRQYGGIGKDVKLPDRSNIEFQVQYKDNLNFQVHFYTDRVNNTGGNCYQLVFNGRYCYIQRYSSQGGNAQLGNWNMSKLKNKFKVSIRTDKEKKSILIIIDGKVVKQIKEEGETDFAGKGTGLLFYSHQGSIKVSNIKVTEWNGVVTTNTTQETKAKAKDSIIFINKDTVTGVLKTIKDGKVLFETPFAPLTIPIDRISSITLGEEGHEKPRRNAGDVKLFFAEGAGRVTMKLKSILDSKIAGSSENFDKATFNLRAFNKMQFNIYTERKAKKDEDDW
jgi:hypothetical protein